MPDLLSRYAREGTPFLFYTDFEGNNIHVYPLDTLEKYDIEVSFNEKHESVNTPIALEKSPVSFEIYKNKFDSVIEKIKSGETYLLNLTQPTPIKTTSTLKTIFRTARAPFKLRVKDEFVCFSPERFVTIDQNRIYTFPMKGTIDASLPDAEKKILSNPKEMAEHIMAVDLLRNDLGMVATDIKVERFRYIEKIHAGNRSLLQVSSKISGLLPSDWENSLDVILQTLLPAGSISGTPKKSTVSIIKAIEGYCRGYFTGVFGIFDGKTLESAVMIRFIEKCSDKYIYKSGGGITLDSDPTAEYTEMIDKVYIP